MKNYLARKDLWRAGTGGYKDEKRHSYNGDALWRQRGNHNIETHRRYGVGDKSNSGMYCTGQLEVALRIDALLALPLCYG